MKSKILGLFSKFFLHKKTPKKSGLVAHLLPRAAHRISRANISQHALKVLYALDKAGYKAYLVGGSVRDLLLEKQPKDFDVATDAKPEQVRALFRNCRLIGRRFRLAHVYFGGHIIEVSTFRGHATPQEKEQVLHSKEGMILRDNIYGTLEDDVFRRDFTINALYYNIKDFTVVDYVGGLKDLASSCMRVIGEPGLRFREDPVRILRAIRFAAKLDFHLDAASEIAIRQSKHWFKDIHAARLLDEFMKIFLMGFGHQTFMLLRRYALFEQLFPQSAEVLKGEEGALTEAFIKHALKDTDQRVQEHRPVSLSFLMAAFLWKSVERVMTQHHFSECEEGALISGKGNRKTQGCVSQNGIRKNVLDRVLEEACDQVLLKQHQHSALPKRLQQNILDIWYFQGRLVRRGRRTSQLLTHPTFRAGFDFLCLRAAHTTEEALQACAAWWKNYVAASLTERASMVEALKPPKTASRRRTKK